MRMIYCITNLDNGKRYVGQTKNLVRRKKQHFTEAPKRCDHPMARAVRKYGRENFEIKVVEECDDSVVDERERYWIAVYRTTEYDFGYNCEDGGNACKSLSEETKHKISESRKRWWISLSEDERESYRAGLRGHRELTFEQRTRASEVRKGIPKSAEHKAKISAAHLGMKHSVECQCKVHSSGQARRVLTDEQIIEVQRLREANWKLHDIALHFEVGRTSIQRALHQAQYCVKA